MAPILDSVTDLLKLSQDELSEKLLDRKYNSANLRELIRRFHAKTHEYKKAFEYERSLNEVDDNAIDELDEAFTYLVRIRLDDSPYMETDSITLQAYSLEELSSKIKSIEKRHTIIAIINKSVS